MKAAKPRTTIAIGEARPAAEPGWLTAGATVLLPVGDGVLEVGLLDEGAMRILVIVACGS